MIGLFSIVKTIILNFGFAIAGEIAQANRYEVKLLPFLSHPYLFIYCIVLG